jgi:hypothetical protein
MAISPRSGFGLALIQPDLAFVNPAERLFITCDVIELVNRGLEEPAW